MKTFLIGSIPLFCIVLFYLIKTREPENAGPKGQTANEAKTTHGLTSLPRLGPSAAESSSIQLQKLNDGLAKSARFMTAEMQERTVSAMMRTRAPHYDKLFKNWNLAPHVSDQVLRLIHDRELAVLRMRKQFFEAGLAGASDYEAAKAAEEFIAEREIVSILGQDRLDSLRRVEEEVNKESWRKAQKYIDD